MEWADSIIDVGRSSLAVTGKSVIALFGSPLMCSVRRRKEHAGVDSSHHASLHKREGEFVSRMHTRYTAHLQLLVDGVLNSPGETDPALRHAIEEQSAQLSLRSPQPVEQVPPALVAYVKKVALYAYKTTEEDIEVLRRAGYSEDAIFEITASAALGAGMTRLERGLVAMKGDTDAAQKD
jgi:hypothetical protein